MTPFSFPSSFTSFTLAVSFKRIVSGGGGGGKSFIGYGYGYPTECHCMTWHGMAWNGVGVGNTTDGGTWCGYLFICLLLLLLLLCRSYHSTISIRRTLIRRSSNWKRVMVLVLLLEVGYAMASKEQSRAEL